MGRTYRPLWSFKWFTEKYEIGKETIVITTGLFNLFEDTEATSAIVDINVKRTLLQRILGLMTIYLKFEHKSVVLSNVPENELFSFVDFCKILIAKRRRVDVL